MQEGMENQYVKVLPENHCIFIYLFQYLICGI